MRYEGNTLREALGKALGTRDQYGRKIIRAADRRAILAAPSQKSIRTIQPAGTPVDVSPGNLQQLREAALQRCRSSAMARAQLGPRHEEEGFMSLYFVDNGEIKDFDEADAGAGRTDHTTGQKYFDYNAHNYRSRPIWVLCWGHTHPGPSGVGSRYLAGPSGDARREDGDYRLLRYAPLIIRHPGGWANPLNPGGYRQYS